MLLAKDFKKHAREALKGRWFAAGGAAMVASLLGGSLSGGGASFNFNFNSGSGSVSGESALDGSLIGSEALAMVVVIMLVIAMVLLLWAAITAIIGGATTLGYAKYNLNLVDDNDPRLKDVISEYGRLGTGFCMQFLRGLFVTLWSLLFFFPGIMASYSYCMTPYILAENPEMGAMEGIRQSKQLMKGNRWRLFCLEISFLGWALMASFVYIGALMAIIMIIIIAGTESAVAGGIVMLIFLFIVYSVILTLTLVPYREAAVAVFYREIKDAKYSNPYVENVEVQPVYETVPEE